MINLLVAKEHYKQESRVAATPETVAKLIRLGIKVLVEKGAGSEAFYSDRAYEQAGAEIIDWREGFAAADIVLKLHPPMVREGEHEAALIKSGSTLVSFVWQDQNSDVIELLAQRQVNLFAMEKLPRITRAQKMDALSSQANIAGYKAVLLAANYCPKLFPLLMTAAGTLRAAKVIVLGAGVAGLQAIATAKRLGAVVEASDVRREVKEQVESLGGRFIEMTNEQSLSGEGGYAKEAGEDFLSRQRQLLTEHFKQADAVITTALIPGRPAPLLVTEEMVQAMPRGSVLVDLAAERGGNCALTQPGKLASKYGVTLVGYESLPAMVPMHASDVYARNLYAVVEELIEEGALKINLEDDIQASSFLLVGGKPPQSK